MRISRRDFVLGAAMRGFAQEPTFSTDVKVVTLLATVHDRDGAIVTNLNRDDFLVEEEGVAQTIRYFRGNRICRWRSAFWSTLA